MECKLDCLVEVVVEIGIPTVARLRVRARDLTDRGKDHVCWQTGLPQLLCRFCGTLHLVGRVNIPLSQASCPPSRASVGRKPRAN